MKTRRNLKLLVPAFLTALALVFTGCDNPLEDLTETTYYTVTFNSNGGSDVEAQKVESGTKAEKPTAPTKASTDTETYAFGGWYTSTDDGTTLSDTAFDFETAITADITLYAKWNASEKTTTPETEPEETPEKTETPEVQETPAETYTITIAEGIENGSVTASKTSATAGETVTLTITPASGYKLDSISVSVDNNPLSLNGSENTKTFTMPSSSVKITAEFITILIGTKTKPNDLGDIVFNDGTALPASVYNTRELTNREKENAIAVVADVYEGQAMAVGLKQEYLAICSNTSQGFTNTAAFSHDGDAGQTRQEICYGENDYITDYSQEKYPAIYWAQNYTGFGNLGRITNDWFIPTKQELLYVYAGKESVIAAINKIGSQYANPFINQNDDDEPYYSTVTNSSNSSSIYQVNLNNGSTAGQYKDTYSPVLVIRYFYCGD